MCDDFGGSDIGGSEFGSSELGGTELGGSELGGSELGGSDIGSSELGSSELGGSEFGSSDLGRDVGDDIGSDMDIGIEAFENADFGETDIPDIASFDIDSSSEYIDFSDGLEDIELISNIESFNAAAEIDTGEVADVSMADLENEADVGLENLEEAADFCMENLEDEAASFECEEDLLKLLDIEPFDEERISADDWIYNEEVNAEHDMTKGLTAPVRDQTEQWESGLHAINTHIDIIRDDLRDKGYTDEQFIEQTIAPIRTGLMDELSRNIEGDFTNRYEMPELK